MGTFLRECVEHIIPLSEQHLRSLLREYVDYYNSTRPHRTLELEAPAGARPVQSHGRVVSHPVLGGLHFAGAAYDLGGSYDLAFTVFVGTYLLAAVLIMLTPRPVPPTQNQRAAVAVAGAGTSGRLVARGGGSM